MNVLAIGNSFSQDATRYLHQIAAADLNSEQVTILQRYPVTFSGLGPGHFFPIIIGSVCVAGILRVIPDTGFLLQATMIPACCAGRQRNVRC